MKQLRRKSGQGMTEYIIIIAIVAIGCIMIVGLFGQQIKGVFTGISGSLSGSNEQQKTEGFDASGAEAGVREGMDTYDETPGGG